MADRRFSAQSLSLLSALGQDPTVWRHGCELAKETALASGTLYPVLIRLADRGLVEACWEEEQPAGRPRRHLYRLMTGAQAPAVSGGEGFRAGHVDREQVIEALKDAFVQGRLTRDELDARAGRALSARTCVDLAALIADIPSRLVGLGALSRRTGNRSGEPMLLPLTSSREESPHELELTHGTLSR